MQDGNTYHDEKHLKLWKPPPTEREGDHDHAQGQLPAPSTPSFPHFTKEEQLILKVLGMNPLAGWDDNGIPAFTNNYRNLELMTGQFPDNGQPPEVNKRRVWSTDLTRCASPSGCGGLIAAHWVDRWTLKAGYYCDSCHKDYSITSYLEYELNRKPEDAIISNYQGYLSDNPDFQSFTLFEPGTIAFLAAGMGLGKTTAIIDEFVALCAPGQKGLLLGPRISQVQALATLLRKRDGRDAWGLFHQGSGNDNRYIGEYGAIGCLSSLPLMMAQAKEQLIDNLLIAIDESDFSYLLKSLKPELAKLIIEILAEAAKRKGLVVAGQTESLLGIEALALELGLNEQASRGFYATAPPTEGQAKLISYHTLEEGYKHAHLLQGAIESIKSHLETGKNVYLYCPNRSDARTAKYIFARHNPVEYNAYTRGDDRARAILRNEKLTDSKLFIATSAACVGINIHDKNAVTVVIANRRFGTLPLSETVQECLRNRKRTDVEIHYPSSIPASPIKPSEAESTSLYHEALKEFEQTNQHAIEHIARDYALGTLANSQPEDYIKHHLKTAGYTDLSYLSVWYTPERDKAKLDELKPHIKEAKAQEDKAVAEQARLYFQRGDLLTEDEIRQRSINGSIDGVSHLAHERLNKACQAVGWDGKQTEDNPISFDDIFDAEQKKYIEGLIKSPISDSLDRQRRGWLSVRAPHLTTEFFTKQRKDAELAGMESSAVKDDRFLGTVLRNLIDAIKGQTFTTEEFGNRIKKVLTATLPNSKKTILSLLKEGALGPSVHKQVRFLGRDTDNEVIIEWIKRFLPYWYPCTIRGYKIMGDPNEYTTLQTTNDHKYQREIFAVWAEHRLGAKLDTDEPINEQIYIMAIELEKKAQVFREKAQELRDKGKTVKDIADELGGSPSYISKYTTAPPPVEDADLIDQAQQLKAEGKSQREIAETLSKSRRWVAKHTAQVEKADKHADKKTRAKQLKAEGKPLREIAELLNVPYQTLQRWMPK